MNLKQRKKNIVLLPSEYIQNHYEGILYGKYFEETGIFNVIPNKYTKEIHIEQRVGCMSNDAELKMDNQLIGIWENESLSFTYHNEPFEVKEYSLYQNIFSRNTGILESDLMREKIAVILGCGSVGSLVALELAKAGVGQFVLVDQDVLEYHNLCRHQCSILDVGDFKVHSVGRRIKEINPEAKVEKFTTVAELIPKSVFDTFCIQRKSIIVGCADNRAADVYGNSISVMYKIPFLSIGFWERAFAGEIFYYLPDSNMPCYKCALGDGSEISQRKSINRRIYTNEEDLENVNFEPGISVDINFVTDIGIKLILDILNIGNEQFSVRLLDTLQQYTLVCNTNKKSVGGEMAEIFSYPLQVTTSLKVDFRNSCPTCEYE